MKKYSFFKNVVVVIISLALTVVMASFAGVSAYELLWGLTLMLAYGVVLLVLEDVARKFFTAKEDLTWQYFVGLLLIFITVALYLWMASSEVWLDFFYSAAVFAFACTICGLWMHFCYSGSLLSPEEKEKRVLARTKAAVGRIKDKEGAHEEAASILYNNLRYRLVGDSLDGDIDLEAPLAVYDDTPMTYVELMAAAEKSDADQDSIVQLKQTISNYVDTLLQGFSK